VTDPDVPTLPPHITFEQAKNYASAILKGDPDALGIIWKPLKEAVTGHMPGKSGT
jgi:pyruvate dehydrogenase (quinone)